MDQIKVGAFLKELRKEKELTQQQLAEMLNVSDRTVSRWETGNNMPDISMIVELADFYDVSIPEIISGERKSENMNDEIKNTAAAMVEYSRNEGRNGRRKILAALLSVFGIFIIISALSIFPSESSWGSIYSVFGSMILLGGVYIGLRQCLIKRGKRFIIIAACVAFLFAAFSLTDYVAAKHFDQVPRFRYQTSYDSRWPDKVVHKTLFFTAVQENPGTKEERVYILE